MSVMLQNSLSKFSESFACIHTLLLHPMSTGTLTPTHRGQYVPATYVYSLLANHVVYVKCVHHGTYVYICGAL